MTFEEYTAEAKKHLSEKRFYHSQCVAAAAAELAERFGADVQKARTAGILHDIMKDTPGEEQLKILSEFDIILSDTERANPKLWHAVCGAAYIEHVLGVSDAEIIDAVKYHTSGRGSMPLLLKCLFVADYISADRDYPGVEEMREYAAESLEKAIAEGVAFTIGELAKKRLPIAAASIDAYNEAILTLNNERK